MKADEPGLRPRLLLDTHIVVRWLIEPRKLSREQLRLLRDAAVRSLTVSISAMTLLEIAVLDAGRDRFRPNAEAVFRELEASPMIQVLPFTYDIAAEVAALGTALRDPADRAIVATARVHRLRLLTSDQRIIESGLVPVVA